MYKKRVACLTVISLLLCLAVFCPVGYSADVLLTLDDLPRSGESMSIVSDGELTVNQGETAVIEGNLQVNGTDSTVTTFKLINYGELTLKNTEIRCNHANFTLENRGILTVQTSHITVIGNSTLNLSNTVDCNMTNFSLDVYGGFAYIQNTGSLTIYNGYFKDQNDGTFITNYGAADLSECTFVANGAYGKIEIFSNTDLHFRHGTFDVNYGGTVNLNTLLGTLALGECSFDVSGASHGKQSQINILCGNSTWEFCSFVNNAGTINCLNTLEK